MAELDNQVWRWTGVDEFSVPLRKRGDGGICCLHGDIQWRGEAPDLTIINLCRFRHDSIRNKLALAGLNLNAG